MPITWRLPYGLVATVIVEGERGLDDRRLPMDDHDDDDDDRVSRGRLRDRMTDSPTAADNRVK